MIIGETRADKETRLNKGGVMYAWRPRRLTCGRRAWLEPVRWYGRCTMDGWNFHYEELTPEEREKWDEAHWRGDVFGPY